MTYLNRLMVGYRKANSLTVPVGSHCSCHLHLVRQDKLAGWLFKCSCRRCISEVDLSRGFRCPGCGAGVVFFKTDKDPNSSDPGVTTSSVCKL